MALNIIQPNEPMTVNAIKVYIYGDPSMGKSTLGMTAKNALVIDADKGAYRVGQLRRAPVQLAETWEQVVCLTESDLEPFETIVIDTIGRLLEIVKVNVGKAKGNTKRDGSLMLHAHGIANNTFQTFVNRMISCGKNVVFLAHATEDKDDEVVIHRPDLGGKNRQEIYRLSDCMAYFTYERDQHGKEKRLLKFSHGEKHHSKDCAGLGDIEVPDLADHPTFLGDLIDGIKNHLNTMTPEQKAQIEIEQGWVHWQQLCHESKYASEFNTLMSQLEESTENPYFQGMWDCLKHCAKDSGLIYDKNSRRWNEQKETA